MDDEGQDGPAAALGDRPVVPRAPATDALAHTATAADDQRNGDAGPGSAATQVAEFRLLRKLGAGGMGVVYLARDELLERNVALKLISADVEATPEQRRRLLREARAAAALSHPAIATVYRVGEDAGRAYIAMEFVDGRDLAATVRDARLPTPRALDVLTAIADALAAAHSEGVVHRDVKPHNVMVGRDGRVKLLDFGLAQVAESSNAELSATGAVRGTPAYLSPEQARGQRGTAQSDVFSWGVTAYELLSGQRPFAAATPAETIIAVATQKPAPLATRVPDLPLALTALVDRCLAKPPTERPQNGAELAQALRDAVADAGSAATVASASTVSGHPRALAPEALPGVNPGRDTPPANRNRARSWLAAGFGALAATAVAAPALLAPSPRPTAAPTASPEPLRIDQVVATAMPWIALVVRTDTREMTAVSAGIVSGDSVITALDALPPLDDIGVLFYDPSLPTYAPADGGLDRFVFENESRIVPATMNRGDPMTGLALLRVETQPHAPTPVIWRDAALPGETVLALGHRADTLWTFAQGRVSAVHRDAVEHDATLATGLPGAAVVDLQGRLVALGVSDRDGSVVARSRDSIERLIAGGRGALAAGGLESPRDATLTSMRMIEDGDGAGYYGCLDADAANEFDRAALRRALEELQMDAAQRDGILDNYDLRAARTLERYMYQITFTGRVVATLRSRGVAPEFANIANTKRADTEAVIAHARERTGMHLPDATDDDPMGVRNTQAIYKMGFRVDAIEHVDDDTAWVRASGRNLDASPWSASSLRVRRGDRWLEVLVPNADQLATLPKGWPQPAVDWDTAMENKVAAFRAVFKRRPRENSAGR